MAEQPEMPPLSLDTIAGGGLTELFEAEMERVLENLLDPNTHPTAKRSITLTITVEPDEHTRHEARIKVEAKSKLASAEGLAGNLFVGRRRGKIVATTYDPRQMQMRFDEEDKPVALRPDESLDEDTGEIRPAASQ